LRPFGRIVSRNGRVAVRHPTIPAHEAGGPAIVPFEEIVVDELSDAVGDLRRLGVAEVECRAA
jgi:hypothetical protein